MDDAQHVREALQRTSVQQKHWSMHKPRSGLPDAITVPPIEGMVMVCISQLNKLPTFHQDCNPGALLMTEALHAATRKNLACIEYCCTLLLLVPNFLKSRFTD